MEIFSLELFKRDSPAAMIDRAFIFYLQFSTIAASFFKQNPITDGGNCDETASVVTYINFLYFEDQHSLTLIDTSDYSVANTFVCFQGNHFRPVDIYDDIRHFRLSTGENRSSLFTFASTEGFLLKVADEQLLEVLKVISIHNPRTKILILMFESTVSDAKKLLQKAYHDLKMLRVACIVLKAQFVDGKYFNTLIDLILFNPFVGGEQNVVAFNITAANYAQQIAQVNDFVKKRVQNLQGFPLRISMYEYPMISKPEFDENGKITHFSRAEGDHVSTIAKFMNFTPVYLEPDNYRLGSQLPNGTFVGYLARIEYGRADLAGNARLIADFKTKNLGFLEPVMVSKQYFIIRRRETHKLVMIAIFSQFDIATKIVTLAIFVFLPVVCVTFARYEYLLVNPGKKADSTGTTIMFTIALFFNISTKLPKGSTARILTATALFFVLIESTLLQSNIFKNLNSKKVFGKISSVAELADEGYKIKMPAGMALIFRQPGENKVSWLMTKTGQSYTDVGVSTFDLEEILPKNKRIAFLWDGIFTSSYLDQFYDNVTGENLFERVPEVAFEFSIAMTAPNYSPFIESFNKATTRYVESHVPFHLINKAISEYDRFRIHRTKKGMVPKISRGSITLGDIKSVFQVHILLLTLASVSFVSELVTCRRERYVENRVAFTM